MISRARAIATLCILLVVGQSHAAPVVIDFDLNDATFDSTSFFTGDIGFGPVALDPGESLELTVRFKDQNTGLGQVLTVANSPTAESLESRLKGSSGPGFFADALPGFDLVGVSGDFKSGNLTFIVDELTDQVIHSASDLTDTSLSFSGFTHTFVNTNDFFPNDIITTTLDATNLTIDTGSTPTELITISTVIPTPAAAGLGLPLLGLLGITRPRRQRAA